MAYTKEEREFIEQHQPLTPREQQFFGGTTPSLGEILEELDVLYANMDEKHIEFTELLEELNDAFSQSVSNFDSKMYEILGYLQLHVDEEEEE